MSRPLRIEYPGAWYNVMNRGRRRERIFESSKDYEMFYSTKNLGFVLGSVDFKEWMKEKFQEFRFHKEMPEAMILAPDPGTIMDLVSRRYRIELRESHLRNQRGERKMTQF